MKRISRARRGGWRRRGKAPRAAEVLAELNGRVLTDDERCRVVWEEANDPMALAVAVSMANLPTWLADSLIEILTDDRDGGHLTKLWRRRAGHALDRHRASAVASVRQHGFTWHESAEASEGLMRNGFDNVAHVTAAAMKRSYGRVSKNLQVDSGLYYLPPLGFNQRRLAALERQVAALKERLEAARATRK